MALASNRYGVNTGAGMELIEAKAFACQKVAAVRERQQPLAVNAPKLWPIGRKVLAAFELNGWPQHFAP